MIKIIKILEKENLVSEKNNVRMKKIIFRTFKRWT